MSKGVAAVEILALPFNLYQDFRWYPLDMKEKNFVFFFTNRWIAGPSIRSVNGGKLRATSSN